MPREGLGHRCHTTGQGNCRLCPEIGTLPYGSI